MRVSVNDIAGTSSSHAMKYIRFGRTARTHRGGRGVATMVGAVIAIAIIATVVATFFMTNQLFTSDYQNTVSAVAEYNRQIAAERMDVSATNQTTNYLLKVRVENTGGIPLKVNTLIIVDKTNQSLWTPGSPLPYQVIYDENNLPLYLPRTINPGENEPSVIDFQTPIHTLVASQTHNFTVKALTDRGNVGVGVFPGLVPLSGTNGTDVVTETELSVGYGPIRLNFDSLRFINTAAGTSFDGVDQTGRLAKLTLGTLSIPGYPAFSLPASRPIIFAGNFTNRDAYKRAVELNSYSMATAGAAPSSDSWYIVKDSTPTMLAKGQNIVMVYERPTLLFFSADKAGESTVHSTPTASSTNWFSGIFITGSGKYSDGSSYGQTLPFIAVNLVDYTSQLSRYRGPAGTVFNIAGSKFSSNSFATDISAGLLLEDGTVYPLVCTTSCTETSGGNLSGSFQIPPGLTPGYYAVFITDGIINSFWVTFQVT